MKERKVLTKGLAGRYRKGSKEHKGQILDQFVQTTGHNRSYASRLLRNDGRRVQARRGVTLEGDVQSRAKRPWVRRYGPKVIETLKKVWDILNYIRRCPRRSKRRLRSVNRAC